MKLLPLMRIALTLVMALPVAAQSLVTPQPVSDMPSLDNADNCFSIIAGKDATADGSVLFGHNEDEGGLQLLSMNIGSNGIWCEFPGNTVADCFINAHGVCIASDGCRSREDSLDISQGGVVYEVRFRVWQQALSARDAVRIIAREVETYGYRASGRTYAVADPDEGWLVSVVKGRHWVAQRVPDDMVASIPNYYTIGRVDLSDTANFMGSPDLIDYAIRRGWYNPERDGDFSFRDAYASSKVLRSDHNIPRHERVINALGQPFDAFHVPFAVKADCPIDIPKMRALLGSHTTPLADGSHPHNVCAHDTNLSAIFQLRNWLPLSIGCILWACPGKVCAEVHVPWYLGMTKSPDGFQRFATMEEAAQKHFSDAFELVNGLGLRERYPDALYWTYEDRWKKLDAHYTRLMRKRTPKVQSLQQQIFDDQSAFDQILNHMTPAQASEAMNTFTAQWVRKTL